MTSARPRNAIIETFEIAMQTLDLVEKGDTWYREFPETVFVVNLQRSSYGPSYYVNLGVWISRLSEAKWPKEQDCHLRARLGELIEDFDKDESLMNLDSMLPDRVRRSQLLEELVAYVGEIAASVRSMSDLQSSEIGQDWIEWGAANGAEVRDILGLT